MPTPDDNELSRMILDPAQRRKAFEVLVRRHSEQLYWQVRRIVVSHDDANDVVQNALLKAWNSLDTFKGDAKPITWLTRIAINEALDFVRRQKAHPTLSADDAETGLANRLLADEYFDGDATDALLQEAIQSLPEVQRTVFLMRYYDEMRYSDITHILGTSEGGLKASYHIAVKKISEFFHRHD